uniref:Ig-like domain-containing protein n=1 Tax=Anabas testudineus TaxID=64144 RepID=A0A3Q1K0C1_ANATE
MVFMIGLTRAGQGRTKGRMWPAGLNLPRSAVEFCSSTCNFDLMFVTLHLCLLSQGEDDLQDPAAHQPDLMCVEDSESQDQRFSGRVQFDKDVLREGRIRLQLSRLRTNDSGLYLCEVKTDQGWSSDRCRLNVIGELIFIELNRQKKMKVKPGDDVSLPCQGPRGADIRVLEWEKPELKTDGYVFFFRERRSYGNYQHPSYCGRVELKDPEMKDGDVSVILKNVTINDTGTYECYVGITGSYLKLINTINLTEFEEEMDSVVFFTHHLPDTSTFFHLMISFHCLFVQDPEDHLLPVRGDRGEESQTSGLKSQDQQFSGRVQFDKDVLREGRIRVQLSRLRTNDSGLYLCEVRTDLGWSSDRCRLNVTGEFIFIELNSSSSKILRF